MGCSRTFCCCFCFKLFAVYWRNMDNFHSWVAQQGELLFNPGWIETSTVVTPSTGRKCRTKRRPKKCKRRPKKVKKCRRKPKKAKKSKKRSKKSAPKRKKRSCKKVTKKAPIKKKTAKKLSPCQKAAPKQKKAGTTALKRGHYIKGKCHAKSRKFHYTKMSHCWKNKDYCHFVEPVKQPKVCPPKKNIQSVKKEENKCNIPEPKKLTMAQRLRKEIKG